MSVRDALYRERPLAEHGSSPTTKSTAGWNVICFRHDHLGRFVLHWLSTAKMPSEAAMPNWPFSDETSLEDETVYRCLEEVAVPPSEQS